MAAIIGVPDEKWGETGMAFIVPAPNETITEKEILDYLKDKVARYKYPARFKFMTELPLDRHHEGEEGGAQGKIRAGSSMGKRLEKPHY
ncbi:MAG: hypothetical protein MZV70_39100 [Desulfobacterales bacterium]|nr:hypothetical protein [Desulfobacterales bacterium]